MRLAVSLATVLLVGCSPLLGIEDPKLLIDAGPDIDGPPSGDRLVFSLADFKLAQQQTVRVRVRLMRLDATMEDVTSRVEYSSDDETVATIGAKGEINGASKMGTATITAKLGDAMPATVRATVKATQCHPVINEFATAGATGGADAANEFVELYNPCTSAVDVAGWTLKYRGGADIDGTDSATMVTLAGQMPAGAIRLYAGSLYPGASDGTWPDGSGMGQTNGAVGLRSATAALIDSIAYGTVTALHPFAENNQSTSAMTSGFSASRLPFDGKDDDDNKADVMVIATGTPGAPNVP